MGATDLRKYSPLSYNGKFRGPVRGGQKLKKINFNIFSFYFIQKAMPIHPGWLTFLRKPNSDPP